MAVIRDIRTKEEIIINVGKRDKGNDLGSSKRRGGQVVGSKPNDGILKRRTKDESYINFYDLGQKKAGAGWIDIGFSLAPTQTDPASFDRFDASGGWGLLRDLIFAIDPADWKTQYRKLGYEDAERYGLDLYDIDTTEIFSVARNGSRRDISGAVVSGSKWEAKGLKLDTVPINYQLKSFGAFEGFAVYGSGVKFTNGPTFASPGVSFTLNKKADIFLVPLISTIDGFSSSISDNTNDAEERLIGLYRPLDRNVWLAKNYESGFPLLSYDLFSDASPGDRALILDWSKEGGVLLDAAGVNIGSPALFPHFTPYKKLQIARISSFGFSGPLLVIWQPGTFLGAVFQGGQMFFVWADATEGGISTPFRLYDV